MKRLRSLFFLFLAFLALGAAPALAQIDQQKTVNNAASTIERLKTTINVHSSFLEDLQHSRAVLIVPDLYKGGFIIGGQYGNGVLLAHLPDGNWSSPAI